MPRQSEGNQEVDASGENFTEIIAQLCYDQSWEADGGLPKYLLKLSAKTTRDLVEGKRVTE